ncbi:MAG: DUF3071 domain-containing protein [Propionibacteriaceae bacterium]|nr:DUF3071 domain-containing protein [Propionibacteriaceae bacterium]
MRTWAPESIEEDTLPTNSSFTPREIQTRVRSGESVADLVAESGMPPGKIEAFAAPILAEREHMWALALSSPVRRLGETASSRRLRQVLAESLLEDGLDIDLFAWDSWRRSDGRWVIRGECHEKAWDRSPQFVFDPRGHFSVADNDEARHLIGDPGRSAPPPRRHSDPDSEPTVEVESVHTRRPRPVNPVLAPDEDTIGIETLRQDPEPEYREETSFVSDMDLLYEMISKMDEDSVRIYRGLRDPVVQDASLDLPLDDEFDAEDFDEASADLAPEPEPAPVVDLRAEHSSHRRRSDATVVPFRSPSSRSASAPAEEQKPLPVVDEATEVDDVVDPEPSPARRKPKPRPKRQRASVPSWDEIMFGGRGPS